MKEEIVQRRLWNVTLMSDHRYRMASREAQAFIESRAMSNREIILDYELHGEMPDARE